MRLTLREIDAILGMIGNVDRHAMAEECTTEALGELWLEDCERAEEKLFKRYHELKARSLGYVPR